MDDILALKCSQLFKGPKFASSEIYVWSDFHFNNPEIMTISKRPFYSESTIIPGLQVPSPDKMQEHIIKELDNIPKNSVLFNLGDLGRLNTIEDEKFFTKLNEKLHKKNIKHYLILGNHDFLKDNLIYSAYAGNEIEFYKKLGFDEVFLNTVGCIINSIPIFFSHKPLTSVALSCLISNLPNADKLKNGQNFHGHWHSHVSSNLRSRSACIDMTTQPYLLGEEISQDIPKDVQLYLVNVPDNGFEPDPW